METTYGNFTARIFLVLTFAVAPAFGGCKWTSTPADIQFSPQGDVVAYSFAKCWDLPLPPELPTFRTVPYVRWCKITSPQKCRTAKLPASRTDYGYYIVNNIIPIFSPDSRQIAVIGPEGLFLADVGSDDLKRISPPGEEVKTAGWIDNNEIGYATHTKRKGKYGEVIDLAFWRHNVDGPPNARTQIHGKPGIDNYPEEHWSPDGAHVIFAYNGGYFPAQYLLLEVATGRVTELGSPEINTQRVTWKPDGKAAVIFSTARTDPPLEVLLIDIPALKTTDLSERFYETFGVDIPDVDTLWTPDGQYLVVNSTELGGCLVRPDPWEVIQVSEKIAKRLYPEDDPSGDRLPWIFRQPAAGWLRIWVPSTKRDSIQIAVDYRGENYFTIGENSTPGGGWTLTPDAKNAVSLDKDAAPMVVKTEP